MASCSNAQSSSQDGNIGLVESTESPVKSDENHGEGNDVDFDLSRKETLSPEASSSLSSEVQALDVVNALEVMDDAKSTSLDRVDKENAIPFGTESSSDKQVQHRVPVQNLENSPLENFQATDHKHNKASHIDDDNNLVNAAGLDGGDSEEEDAICKRTRARYSLTSFTLDELESFLQETDDDDDMQNVDDEKEYRKFLAVVLQGNNGDGDNLLNHQVNENVDDEDEDEDNDADFEIELEEALDSDLDEKAQEKETQKGSGRRPETRQNNKILKSSNEKNNKFITEPGKRPPLRPLLPLPPTIPHIPLPTSSSAVSMLADSTRLTVPESSVGFTPHQIFQLHCLAHEHVQLLIQTHSLCVLDSSRQQYALQMQELIFEILHMRDQVLSWRNVPYPGHIFQPFLDGSLRNIPEKTSVAADSYVNGTKGVSSSTDQRQPENVSPSEGVLPAGPVRSYLAMNGFHWVPNIRVPVFSVLDVAPLKLIKTYFDEVSTVVRDFRRRNVESSCDTLYERVPLFDVSPTAEVNPDCMNSEESSTDVLKKTPSSSSQPQKKTLAAALVETTKKQSIALVPKEVANLAKLFLPLFNQTLFPHKPPPVAVTNRVLFTDSEDELLALGMMAYNTDWKTIQQRFLPCKSKHQIFVRQKNRCSAKAPDNPIKAVRRMKTSPLTMEELRQINEGLKVYKLDWMSVWKLIVPHRDPSLLPRQWRTATGIQKSYKQDPAKKERRRIYEADRRRKRSRAATSFPTWQQHGSEEDNQAGEENSSGDDCIDDPEEETPYVHQGFLADWRPGEGISSCNSISSSSRIITNAHGSGSREASNLHQVPWQNRPPPYVFPAVGHVTAASGPSVLPNRPQLAGRRRRSKKTEEAARLVKLAPNLPPVNLPQNVRIISNNSAAALRSHHQSCAVNSATRRITIENAASSSHQNTSDGLNKAVVQETRTNGVVGSSELQQQQMMHPLLFQVPPVGHLPYYPLLNTATGTATCGGSAAAAAAATATATATAFNFFSGQVHPPQLLLRPSTENDGADDGSGGCLRNRRSNNKKSRRVIDFHPLLQRRADDDDSNLVSDCAAAAAEHTNEEEEEEEEEEDTAFPSSLLLVDNNNRRRSNEVLDLEIHLSSTASELVPPPQSHTTTRFGGSLLDREDTQSSNPAGLIVMEQEELSDSDDEEEEEEIDDEDNDEDGDDEEHVEFECEEMDDSSSEGEAEAPSLMEQEDDTRAVSTIGNKDSETTTSLDLWLPPKKNTNKKLRTSWLTLDSSSAAAAAANQCQTGPPNKTGGRRSSRSPATTFKSKRPPRKQSLKTTSSKGAAAAAVDNNSSNKEK